MTKQNYNVRDGGEDNGEVSGYIDYEAERFVLH